MNREPTTTAALDWLHAKQRGERLSAHDLDHGSSQEPAPSTCAKSQPNTERQPAPALRCDLCQWPMSLPEHCREQGEILGLLVCSQCVEDNLANSVEPRTEVGLVGSCGGGR